MGDICLHFPHPTTAQQTFKVLPPPPVLPHFKCLSSIVSLPLGLRADSSSEIYWFASCSSVLLQDHSLASLISAAQSSTTLTRFWEQEKGSSDALISIRICNCMYMESLTGWAYKFLAESLSCSRKMGAGTAGFSLELHLRFRLYWGERGGRFNGVLL